MTISTAISLPSSIRAQAASDDSSMRHKPNIETKKCAKHLDVGLGEGIHSHLLALLATLFQVTSVHRKYVSPPQKSTKQFSIELKMLENIS